MIKQHTIAECPQVERLALLEKGYVEFEHILKGNGQEGLVKKQVRFEEKLDRVLAKIDDVQNTVQEVSDYKKEQQAVEKDRGLRTVHLKWLIGTVIVLFLGVAGLVIDNKKQNSKYNEILKIIENENRSKNDLQR